jgi:GH25 family lysozyme M1 (1,4-beta-N-acetylmuramidase)/uncharacterized protein YraI
MANLIGPDVSFYQDDPGTPQGIDFVKMKQSAGYVIVRAGQNVWIDSDFKTNWRDSKDAGLPRGSYWFYDSRADPKEQAELWFSVFEGDLGELPLFADFEEAYGGLYTGWRHWKTFLERLRALVGNREIGIYTAFYYWIRNAPSATTDPTNLEYFHRYPLWIANYDVATPSVPGPWSANEWLFWQFTDRGDGRLYGVESSRIDLNYFNGDLAAFRQRFNLSPTPPPPPGSVWYKVTASALNVRKGPGTNFDVVGLLRRDEVVEGLGLSNDGAWAQIKRPSDTLTGWAFRTFLILTSPPTTPPPPPPPPPTADWYKVTASALNVREGPATTFPSIGLIYRNEVVQRLETSADGNWFKVKRNYDGFTGWCAKQYLTETTAPPTVVEKTWFRVTATALNVREGPGVSYNSIGYLTRNESVVELENNADRTWKKIERGDGFTGWCSSSYLTSLGKSPALVTQKLFTGVTYTRKYRSSPTRLVSHALVVDLRAATFEFLVTPPLRDTEPFLCTRTTSGFLEKYQLHMAINADGFYYLDPSTYDPQQYCGDGGEPVKLIGLAASRGKQYSTKAPGRPILYISKRNEIAFDRAPSTIFNAVTGDRLLVTKGVKVSGLEAVSRDPRTAVGVSRDGRRFVMLVVDGREFSEGATFPELADLLISYGVYTGMALDGGGSSAMIIRGKDDKPRALNTLMEDNTPGKERAVANHLGIFIRS